MQTLSIIQPWATLCVIGAKKFETRSWSTLYRGPLLIHASKKWRMEDRSLCTEWPFDKYLFESGLNYLTICDNRLIPLGAIIGQVDLVDCITTEEWSKQNTGLNLTGSSMVEFEFGDFSPGRFAWQLENPVKFDKPIPAKGSLGLWGYAL